MVLEAVVGAYTVAGRVLAVVAGVDIIDIGRGFATLVEVGLGWASAEAGRGVARDRGFAVGAGTVRFAGVAAGSALMDVLFHLVAAGVAAGAGRVEAPMTEAGRNVGGSIGLCGVKKLDRRRSDAGVAGKRDMLLLVRSIRDGSEVIEVADAGLFVPSLLTLTGLSSRPLCLEDVRKPSRSPSRSSDSSCRVVVSRDGTLVLVGLFG